MAANLLFALTVLNVVAASGDRASGSVGGGGAVLVDTAKPEKRTFRFGLTAGDVTTRIEIQGSNDGTTWQSLAAFSAAATSPAMGIVIDDNSAYYRTLRVAGTTACTCAMVGQGVDSPFVGDSFNFGAVTSLVNAAAQYVPAGGGAATTLTALPGIRASRDGTISGLAAGFTGDAANVGGQTMLVEIFKNGVLVISIAALPTTAGAQAGTATAANARYVTGDVLQCVVTPSGALTAAVTQLTVTAGS